MKKTTKAGTERKNAAPVAENRSAPRAMYKARSFTVTPEIAIHVRQGAAACGMTETHFAAMAIREFYLALEAAICPGNQCFDFSAVTLHPGRDSKSESIPDTGGRLGYKITADGTTMECIARLDQFDSYRLVKGHWWQETWRALKFCCEAAVWQDGPRGPFTVELRDKTQDEEAVRRFLASLEDQEPLPVPPHLLSDRIVAG